MPEKLLSLIRLLSLRSDEKLAAIRILRSDLRGLLKRSYLKTSDSTLGARVEKELLILIAFCGDAMKQTFATS